MVNFKFVKSQYRKILVPLIVLSVATLAMLIPAFTKPYMGQYLTDIVISDWGSIYITHAGAMDLLQYVYFGIPGFIIMFIFSIILNHLLISKEVQEGYMASWLTSSMSRRTIINSKLFVLLSGMGAILLSSMILQLIIFGINLKVFPAEAVGKLILANIDFILVILLFSSINWVITNFFNKSSYSIAIIGGILAFFAIMSVTSLLYKELSQYGQFKYFKVTQYFTITNLFNFPFKFDYSNVLEDTYASVAKGVKALDYAWQIPLMIVLLPGFFILGDQLLIKKDLHL